MAGLGEPGGEQRLVKVTSDADGRVTREDLCAVRFVPLIGALLRLCGPGGAEQALGRCERAYVPFRSLALGRLAAAKGCRQPSLTR